MYSVGTLEHVFNQVNPKLCGVYKKLILNIFKFLLTQGCLCRAGFNSFHGEK